MADEQKVIKSQSDIEKTPEGWAEYWGIELRYAETALKHWKEGADTCVKEFLDDRGKGAKGQADSQESHINLFWANIVTMRAMLFGRTPEVDVVRRHADQDDDDARISGPVIMQRVLNTDIENGTDGYKYALKNALSDFLLTGFGNAWIRYEAKFKQQPAKMRGDKVLAPAALVKDRSTEDAIADFVRWDDHLWSPCDIFENMRWAAKRVPMTKEMMEERFGPEVAEEVSLDENKQTDTKQGSAERKDPWSRAEVWEIWSKEHRKVFWYCKTSKRILDVKDDILGLKNFWPFPRPMFANLTTSALVPRPDYAQVQDLYRDINNLQTRIALLESALRVAGVCDKTAEGLQELVNSHALENIIIPVDSWAALSEKGGLEGVISFLPIEQIANVIGALTAKLEQRKQMLYELTGMNDLTRGSTQEMEGGEVETATAQRLKSRYSNVRIQAVQDEFARFATELQQIRAEVMVKHFDIQTILHRSNVLHTPDAQEALLSIQNLKDEFPNYRIEVKSENIAMQDFTQLKMERSEFLQAISTLMRDALPMAQLFPQAIPILLETIKWALAGFRGSAQIEGVFDKAIKQAATMMQQMQQGGGPGGPEQNPEAMAKMMELGMKQRAEEQKIQAKSQADQAKAELEVRTEAQKQEIQTRANIAETLVTEQIKAETRRGEMQQKLQLQAHQQQERERERQAREYERMMNPKPRGGGR